MKKVLVEDEKSAVEYVQMVLREWGNWQKHHIYLVQALQILLRVNNVKSEVIKSKCEMITDMKNYIDALHRHIDEIDSIECNDNRDSKEAT